MRTSLSAAVLAVTSLFGPETAARDEAAPASLFTLVKTVTVTPSGNYRNADFVRIGYVPGRERIIVTFGTQLQQPESGCSTQLCPPSGCFYPGYAYKEYTTDMVETGKAGIVSCHAISDTGGTFNGDDFYLASAELKNGGDGWNLAKFDAVTWTSSVDFYYPFTDSTWVAADPTVALVNGQIDVSGGYAGPGTHHNFFTTDLQFVSKRLLTDAQHIGFSSMINQGGVTHFLSSQPGNPDWSAIVMQYDSSWTYLGVKTLREHAATPQGLAFDGTRFYVAYTDRQTTNGGLPLCENVHLAAFDTSWNLIEDIALTSHTLQEQASSIHPWVLLKDNRLYVSYSENVPAGGVETPQAYVQVFDLSTASACASFAISPTTASATASAGSQAVTVTGSPSGCTGGSWTASSSASWLSVSSASGSGSGSVTVSWVANSGAPRSGAATIAGSTFTVSQAAATTTATLQGDWVPCGPPGGAVGGAGQDVSQPQRTRVMIARSTDGLTFTRPSTEGARLLVDQADVPDAIVLPSGRILVYLVSDCRDHTPFGGTKDVGLGVAVSDARGAPGSWVFKDVKTDHAAHGLGPPVDPNIVLWRPEQNLLRLFATEFPGGLPTCYSYTSTDGFNFTYEGKRYDPGGPIGVFDPETFRFGDGNWQIITGNPNGYAMSTDDGASFTKLGPFPEHVVGDPNYTSVPHEIAVTNTPGVFRVFATNGYGEDAFRIESLRSTESPFTSWQKEGTVLEAQSGMEKCGVGFPTVVKLAADYWLMFYATVAPNCVCGGGGTSFHCDAPAAAPPCSTYTISPTSAAASSSAGSKSVTVGAWPSACTGGTWTASTSDSWLSISPSSGSGAGGVTVSWTANTSGSSRTGTVTIGNNAFGVTQSSASSSESVLFVPVVLDVQGNAGSHYTSELTLANRGASSADVRLSYVGASTLGGGGGSAHVTLGAGRQMVVSDAIAYLRSLDVPIPDSGARGGTLTVGFTGLTSPSEGLASVRTTTPVASGQAGLAYAGVPASRLLTGRSFVGGLREDASDRSNLALQNAGAASDGSVTLSVTAHAADGSFSTSLGAKTLEPGGFVQLNSVLAGAGMTNGWIEIERTSGTAPYDAYGVVNDNVSSDGCFVPAQPESAAGVSGLTVPVVVETSVYTSEAVLTNTSSSSRDLTLSLVADSVTTSDHTTSVAVTLTARSQLIIPNVTQYFRDRGAAGMPASGSVVGALFVTGTSCQGVLAAARTSANGDGGRFGVFYPAVPFGGASSGNVWLVGLQQTETSRTNLAIVNTGESGTGEDTFEVDLYDGTTGQLAATITGITRAAKRWGQIDSVLSRFAPQVTQGYARVRRTGGTNPFIAYAVVNDGGSPGQRSDDGAFVPAAEE